DVVQGADLVVLAPTAPIPELPAGLVDRVLVDLDVHRAFPWFSAAPSSLRLLTQYCEAGDVSSSGSAVGRFTADAWLAHNQRANPSTRGDENETLDHRCRSGGFHDVDTAGAGRQHRRRLGRREGARGSDA